MIPASRGMHQSHRKIFAIAPIIFHDLQCRMLRQHRKVPTNIKTSMAEQLNCSLITFSRIIRASIVMTTDKIIMLYCYTLFERFILMYMYLITLNIIALGNRISKLLNVPFINLTNIRCCWPVCFMCRVFCYYRTTCI